MVLALTAKKNIRFVNDKISMPKLDSPLYEDWQNCNTMVLSWLINSMHIDVSSSIMYSKTAREMLIELKNLFLSRFKRLWDQLLNYEPLPECSCGAMKTLSASHDKAYVMRFLMGLNENFETFEIRFSFAMYANSKGNSGNKGSNKKERPLCTHCNMLGHTIDKCNKLHGYPPRYKPKGSTGTSLGDGHHVANVSSSDGVSGMVYGGSGVTTAAGMGTSWAHHR
ncbi:uncharacterized protein LOC126719325 [Quercus robur]|uniref:uncharacterized protein LOC126719325 n=1 Tax=Quercus robur TaxID=38942 RepID=UPI0021618A11|nr:uncharacterized protein LOC126719325 [Quercus robur]